MWPIRQPSDSGSGGTKCIELIWCVDNRYPQIHEIRFLGSNGVIREVHLTAQIDVDADTVRQFLTPYFAENGRRIPIIGQISINGSVELLGSPADAWGFGLPFIENLQAPTVPSGWEDSDTSNQNCPVIPGGPYSNVAITWGSTVPACTAYTLRSL